MLILEYITFFIAISAFILGIINTIIQIRNHRRTKILQKLPLRRRLFKEWYDLAKDFIDRMVITEILEREHFTVYKYQIKKVDGTEFIEPAKQKILFRRYFNIHEEVCINCGFQRKGKKKIDLADIYNLQMINKNFSPYSITIPNDIIPNNLEEIKSNILNNIIRMAKENGVKLKI